MSTRCVIARLRGDGWEGRYHHSDGYPTGMGAFLHSGIWNRPAAIEQFHGDAEAMARFLVDEHPAGWSTIFSDRLGTAKVDKNWRKRSGAPAAQDVRCYCHSGDHEEADVDWLITSENSHGADAEWIYVISSAGLAVLTYDALPVAFVRWSDRDVNWVAIECGEKFERCCHVAAYHFPEAQGRISTKTYLGYRPLEMHDAIGVRINGVEYRYTGSGGMVPKRHLKSDQITQYNPPPNPAKLSDARAAGYVRIHGNQSWELDALEPQVLGDLITEEVLSWRDEELFAEREELEEEHRELLGLASSRWTNVAEFLRATP